MNHRHLLTAIVTLAIPTAAYAGATAVPEPETFALLAIGAIALVAARWRGRK